MPTFLIRCAPFALRSWRQFRSLGALKALPSRTNALYEFELDAGRPQCFAELVTELILVGGETCFDLEVKRRVQTKNDTFEDASLVERSF